MEKRKLNLYNFHLYSLKNLSEIIQAVFLFFDEVADILLKLAEIVIVLADKTPEVADIFSELADKPFKMGTEEIRWLKLVGTNSCYSGKAI
ncbi:hypothetical protein FSZ17_22060 [Cytobacillus dafuensis]|uniref:Uncharacterized protein n=1 Tax=Cytobacillus dafuensis TaxID=1742359 RepID=A0A5B8Z9X8_CYTDA|nr:hypothetical protein FSZ17_22060 [Cytobacillus dafuensis]